MTFYTKNRLSLRIFKKIGEIIQTLKSRYKVYFGLGGHGKIFFMFQKNFFNDV